MDFYTGIALAVLIQQGRADAVKESLIYASALIEERAVRDEVFRHQMALQGFQFSSAFIKRIQQ
ncbi:hypothetical protein FYK55_07075 [Roseiconus nitratireducens]|uniref:Uncharacterized protein n=1 Tax=Roseiconus nitratireducens TaxID=2605748 RepID=A0A5M6DG68_9BACT|nr:hypothetical protein [Roseiconus nitratireducens]KAA5545406.1 hypothetical protein FYK55_07075 [Roseiconus nitratireducens]